MKSVTCTQANIIYTFITFFNAVNNATAIIIASAVSVSLSY